MSQHTLGKLLHYPGELKCKWGALNLQVIEFGSKDNKGEICQQIHTIKKNI